LTVQAGTIQVNGQISTHHATIELSAQSSLTVAASGRIDNTAGKTILDAGASGTLQVAGRIDVSGSASSERGGTVHLLGDKVELLGTATIDASGPAGGGTVLVGGDYQGNNPAVRNATTTFVHADASIRASALESGDGGKIIVWANDSAIVAGSGNLQARGGTHGGNGGLIETSGKRYLYVALAPDASAPAGDAGLWLLDPENVTIVSGGTGMLTGGVFTSAGTTTSIDPAVIAAALNGMNVVINTGSGAGNGDIFVVDAITPNVSGSHTLTLNAFRDIVLFDDIDPTAGTLGVILNAGRNVNFVNGSISANSVSINAGGSVNSGSDSNDITVGGAGAAISIDAASIGASSQPLELAPGSGDVSLTAQTGSIFVRFNVGISTSQLTLSAVAGGQTIGLATEDGSILFDDVVGFDLNTRDDAFDVEAAGANRNIVFSSGVTLIADSVQLQAADDIIAASATPIADTSASDGTISLVGASLGDAVNPLRVNPGAGDLELTATAGDIYVRTTAGDLATSQISLLSAVQGGATISLGADGGGILVDQISQFNVNTNNDHFELIGGTGDITLSASSALTGASATLTATSGEILATVTGTQISTSAAGGLIRLVADAIGSAGQAIVIDPAAGDVEVVADTGDVFLTFAGSFATGQFDELDVTNGGRQIVLTAASGSITVNDTIGFVNAADDHFTLLAPAGGVSFTGGTLTAASVTIDANTTIIRSGVASLDINTSTLDGPISLTADGGIGSGTSQLRVAAGDGIVEATTTTGSIWLTSPSINLGTIQTGAGQQTVSVITTASGNLNVVASSTTDDNWQLSSAGALTLVGAVTLQAGRFTQLQATGALNGGTAAVDFRQVGLLGTISIDAASVGALGDPILVDLDPTSTLDLQANTGDLCLTLVNGDLTASRIVGGTITAAGNGVTISLATQNGSIDLGSPSFLGTGHADDVLRLEARGALGNISLGTSTLTFTEVTLLADGAITSLSTGPAIDTSAADGDITLQSGGPIGTTLLLPLRIEAGGGQVSAITTGALGNIFLESSDDLLLGNIDAQHPTAQTISIATTGGAMQIAADWNTEDLIFLTADGDITFLASANIAAASATLTSTDGTIRGSGDTVPDISASIAIVLTADAVGESATPLLIDPGLGLVGVVSASDAYLDIFNGDFSFTRFSTLNLSGSGGTLDLGVLNGSLGINATFASLANDNLVLSAAGTGGNISVAAGTPLTGLSVELQATGMIQGGGNSADVTASAGNIILSGNQGIGGSPTSPLSVSTTNPTAQVTATTVTGSVFLESPGALRLGAVDTGNGIQNVQIDAASGLQLVAASSTNDLWLLRSSGGGLRFGANSSIRANSFTADVTGAVISDNLGIDVDTSAADGPISLTGAALGDLRRNLVLSLDSGNLSLHALSGGIQVALDGGPLSSSQIQNLSADAVGAAVSLTTLNGSLTLNNLTNFNVSDDLLSLAALGSLSNITFSGSNGPLTAAQATLQAGGSILSTSNAALDIHINTSGGNNPLRLEAGVDIGQTGAPLLVRAGAGQVSAEADTGYIYIQSPGLLLVNHAVANAAGRQISFLTTGSGNSLVVDVDSLSSDGDQWHLTATGDLTLRVADEIRFGQLIDFAASSPDRNVLIESTAGPIVINTIHAGFLTADDNLTLLAQNGDITSPTAVPLTADFLSLQAPSGQIGAATSPLELIAPHVTTMSAGSQWLSTPGLTRIVSANSTAPGGTIGLLSGTFMLLEPGRGFSTVQTNDGQMLVGSAAMLGGKGSIDGDLQVVSLGVVSPGFGGTDAGSIVIMGDVVFNAGSVLMVNINEPYSDPGVDYDHLIVTGSLTLNSPILMLEGAERLSTTVNPIILVELVDPTVRTIGGFNVNAGSLFVENGIVRGTTGQLRANLQFNGGDGNEIILTQLSFLPQRPLPVSLLPRLRIPTFTTLEIPPPVVQVPPAQPVAATPPPIEAESTPIGVRFLEVRIVIVIDEAGNVREEFAMKLSTEWLTNLPAVLRRLPDDRYRIYLLLEGGNEERLVIDVLVRDGRPVEPDDTADESAIPIAPAEMPAGQPGPGQPELLPQPPTLGVPPVNQPAEPIGGHLLTPQMGSFIPAGSSNSGGLYFGAAAAMAAVVASRQSSSRWTEEVDQAAETIGRTRAPLGWRWWRLASDRSESAGT